MNAIAAARQRIVVRVRPLSALTAIIAALIVSVARRRTKPDA
jgi:hypothetical protein